MTVLQKAADKETAILVVDSSKVMLAAARKLLSPHFDVILAETIDAAWDALQSTSHIAAVFTEQAMPGEQENAMVMRLRNTADERYHALPVIVITSSDRNELSRQAAIDAGATDFILKPYDAVDLVTRARAWSGTSRREALLREHNALLEALVMIDPDTRAGNREYFLHEIVKDRSFCTRHGSQHALLYISIDQYERMVTEQGRVAAREATALVADAIRSKCRHEDTFARVANNEFALSLMHTNPLGARVLAERVRQAIGLMLFKPRGMLVTLTVSIGISFPLSDANMTTEQVLDAAARAAQKAARNGGNQTFVSAETGSTKKPAVNSQQNISDQSMDEALPAWLDMAVVMADPQQFIEQLLPVFSHISEADRLQLVERLLLLVETPSSIS